MSFRLLAGQRSEKYHAGQFVSASYATRYPHKVKEDRPPDFDYEWEVTVEYEG